MTKQLEQIRKVEARNQREFTVTHLSLAVASVERKVAGAILFGVFAVVIGNVIARGLGDPLIWADELAVYGMAWVALLGASSALAQRDHISITLLPDMLRPALKRRLAQGVDIALLILLLVLAVVLWRWFDPVNYLTAASPQDYSASTFNFMHQEPTTTLAFGKLWVWLVLPVFNLFALLHVIARLREGAGS